MIINLYKRTISYILAAMFLICIPFIAVADDNNGDDSKLPKWALNFIEYYDLGQDKINYTKKLEYDDGRTVWTGTDSYGNKVTLIYNPDQNQLGVYQQDNKVYGTEYVLWWEEDSDTDYTAHRRFGVVTPGATDVAGNKGSDTKDDSQSAFTYEYYDQELEVELRSWAEHGSAKTWYENSIRDSVHTKFSYDPKTGRKSKSIEYQDKDNTTSNFPIIFSGLKDSDILDETAIYGKSPNVEEPSTDHAAKIGTKRAWTTNSNGALESETITTKNGQTYSYKTDVTNDNANGASGTQVMVITMGNMEIYYDKSDGHRAEIVYHNKNGSVDNILFDKDGKVTGVKRNNSETNQMGIKYSEFFFETHDEYGVPFDNASANKNVTFYDENEFYTEMAADVVYADATGYLMSGRVSPAAKKALADGKYGYFEDPNNPDSDLLSEMDEKINNNHWNPKNTGTEKYKSRKAFNDRLFSRIGLFKVTNLVLGHVYNVKEIINRFLAGALWIAQTK